MSNSRESSNEERTLKIMLRCLLRRHFGGTPFVDGCIKFEQRRHLNPPEMITTNRTFEARSCTGAPIVFTEFGRLADPAISIAEVSRLRISKMNPKTFCRAAKSEAINVSSRR